MITFSQTLTILISTKPIDMRRGIDGLTALITEQLQHNPQSPILFLFGNQQRNKIKGLYWNKNGFMLIYKRLERKKFYLPKNYSSNKLEITHKKYFGLSRNSICLADFAPILLLMLTNRLLSFFYP